MPLSEHEQRILEEIEKRLAEEDPRLVEQVGQDRPLHRIWLVASGSPRWRSSAGLLLLLLFVVSPWAAAAGFVIMVLSALLIYRYLGSSDATRSARCSPRVGSRSPVSSVASPRDSHDVSSRLRTIRAADELAHLARRHDDDAVAAPPTPRRRRSPSGWFDDGCDLSACHRLAHCCTTESPFPGRVTVHRTLSLQVMGPCHGSDGVANEVRERARVHGGIHGSSGQQVHGLSNTS